MFFPCFFFSLKATKPTSAMVWCTCATMRRRLRVGKSNADIRAFHDISCHPAGHRVLCGWRARKEGNKAEIGLGRHEFQLSHQMGGPSTCRFHDLWWFFNTFHQISSYFITFHPISIHFSLLLISSCGSCAKLRFLLVWKCIHLHNQGHHQCASTFLWVCRCISFWEVTRNFPNSSTDFHGFSQRFHGRKFLSLFDDGAGLFARWNRESRLKLKPFRLWSCRHVVRSWECGRDANLIDLMVEVWQLYPGQICLPYGGVP